MIARRTALAPASSDPGSMPRSPPAMRCWRRTDLNQADNGITSAI